jgi:cytochrome P450
MLRWVTPIMLFRRTALRDSEIDGRTIRAGDKIVLYYISANRDETVFPEPDRFCVARAPNPHIAFGVGPHFCLGGYFARHEAMALYEALHPCLRGFERVGPIDRLESNFMNGIKHMPAVIN